MSWAEMYFRLQVYGVYVGLAVFVVATLCFLGAVAMAVIDDRRDK